MAMSLNLSAASKKIQALSQTLQKYLGLVFVVAMLGLYSFLVFRINSLTTAEPSDDAITEKLNTVQRPKVDEDIVSKVQNLEDNSVEVKALFQDARDNPFSE
jgi:hypothetical protein